MNAVRSSSFETASSSGMFTHLQLKPRIALALAFTGWSTWLREHAVPHARLITDHATGFVPVGFDVDYADDLSFLDCEALQVCTAVTTWNPRRFPTVQNVDVAISSHGRPLVRVGIQEVCVRVESPQTLAARTGRLPSSLAAMLDEPDDRKEPPRLLNRRRPAGSAGSSLASGRYEFTVYRHTCEVADQWYSEHVPDYLGASRESLLMARIPDEPRLLPGLTRRIEHLSIGLRRPMTLFDQGVVHTDARHDPHGGLRFTHRIQTHQGMDVGDAVEIVGPEPQEYP